MLVEKLDNWAQQECQEGIQEGEKLGVSTGTTASATYL